MSTNSLKNELYIMYIYIYINREKEKKKKIGSVF